jgi:ribosomal protein L16 Arg81 hydroxylase
MKKIEKIPLRNTVGKKGDVLYIPARVSACP